MRRFALALLLPLGLVTACGDESGGSSAGTPRARPEGSRTVVLISLDTLRPERLGVYGNSPEVSPVIDAFANEAVVFEQALSSAPWTLPAHMTMLTGLDTVAHGVLNAGKWLSGEVVTLAEALAADGFTTAAFTDGGFAAGRNGLEHGFALYDDERAEDGPNGFTRIVPRALDWLDEQPVDDDLFLFLHTFDAHTPYDSPPEETLAEFRARPVADDPRDAQLRHLRWFQQQVHVGLTNYDQIGEVLNDYDAGVHHADAGVGRVLDALRANGRYDDALVIITSDHGESFLEHGLHVGHGIGVRENELHVPLLMKLPGAEGAGQRHDDLVGLVDIARTVLEAQGVAAADHTQGESLVGLVRGRNRRVDWVLGSSTNMRAFVFVMNGWKYVSPLGILPMQGAERHLRPQTPTSVTPPRSAVEYEVASAADPDVMETLSYDQAGDPLGLLDLILAHELLFDHARDPEERRDLSRIETERLDQMRALFHSKHDVSDAINVELIDLNADTITERDPATTKALAALGYLGSGSKEDYRNIPRKMREALAREDGPGMDALRAADTAVHAVRLALAGGDSVTDAELDGLREAGEKYTTWRAANGSHRARVDWRLYELYELVDTHSLDLDLRPFVEAIKLSKQGR